MYVCVCMYVCMCVSVFYDCVGCVSACGGYDDVFVMRFVFVCIFPMCVCVCVCVCVCFLRVV